MYIQSIESDLAEHLDFSKIENVENSDFQKKQRKEDPNRQGLCNICGKVVLFKTLSRHVRSHKGFHCDKCFLPFKNEETLKSHLLVHESDHHDCDQCNQIFKTVTELALHRYVHFKKHVCPICGFVANAKSSNSIIAHIKRHEGKYKFNCDTCGKGFLSRRKLEDHIEVHENIPKYRCELCDKMFTVKAYLKLHHTLNHKKELFGVEEIYQCEVCGRNFTFEKSLRRHLNSIHKIGEDRSVECSVCHKIIANSYNLKKHMRIHTGEKNFHCDVCGKAFSDRKYLKKHMNVHAKEKNRDMLRGIAASAV